MSNIKISFLCMGMIVLLFTACNLDNEVSNGPVSTGDTNQELLLTRGPCSGQPTTKSVTYTDPNTITVTIPLSQINDYMNSLRNNSRYYYKDTCYQGYINCTYVSMISAPSIDYNYQMMTCTLQLSYSGNVYLYIFDDPCADYPSSKYVTVTSSTTETVSGPSDSFGQALSSIMSGSRSYYYTDSCYKGYIQSYSLIMVSYPTEIYPGYMTCTVKICYQGTVYKK